MELICRTTAELTPEQRSLLETASVCGVQFRLSTVARVLVTGCYAQRAPETRQGLVERLGGSKETEEAVARLEARNPAHNLGRTNPQVVFATGNYEPAVGKDIDLAAVEDPDIRMPLP